MTPALLALTRRYQQMLTETALRTSSVVARSLLAASPLDDASAAAWLAQAGPLVEAGRSVAAGLTDSYIANVADLVAPDAGALAYRDGVTIPEVYMRGVIQIRKAISDGLSYQEGMNVAKQATQSRADLDVMLASRQRSNDWTKKNRTRYVRVPDGNACPFCILISTRIYHSDRLMPVHSNCHCTVMPVTGQGGISVPRATIDALREQGVKVKEGHNREIGPTVEAA